MKVIFTENINEYKSGEVAEVTAGFARNFLLPKNLAVAATEDNLAKQKEILAEAEKRHEELLKVLNETKDRLLSEKIVFGRRSEDGIKIFGAVTNADIAELLHHKGYAVEKTEVSTDALSTIGKHKIGINLGNDVKTEIEIEIVPEKS